MHSVTYTGEEKGSCSGTPLLPTSHAHMAHTFMGQKEGLTDGEQEGTVMQLLTGELSSAQQSSDAGTQSVPTHGPMTSADKGAV